MRLYDTARREIVPLAPGPLVTMYSCGITPYDSAHLGHAQVYLTFDILQRRLRDLGHETRCVRNVTDVDDDILRKARELGVHFLDLAAEEIRRFDADMAALGLIPAWSEPRATSAIPDILTLIGSVLDSGHAYQAGGAVYFDVTTFSDFGSVSHLDEASMLALAAEHGGNPDDPNKRHPLDFVLWQPSLPDEPSWESRWGPGRPGWHIECSALALRELGETLDVHGGGRDLVFPHHECETAQSESVTGRPFVAPLAPRGSGRPGRDEDVQVPRQPGLRRGALEGLGARRHPAGPARPPLPTRLGVDRRGHAQGGTAPCTSGGPHPAPAARSGRRRPTMMSNGAGVGPGRLDDDLDTPGALAALDDEARSGRPVVRGASLLGVTL